MNQLLINSLHLFTLSSFAVSWPALKLFRSYFFVVVTEKVEKLGVVFIILFLLLAAPLLMIAAELAAIVVSYRLVMAVHYLFVFALFILLVRMAAKRWLLVLMISISGAFLYASADYFNGLITLLFPLAVVWPAFFIYKSPVYEFIIKSRSQSFPIEAARNQKDKLPPVVFLVLDEVPLLSLLNEAAKIDANRFPNIAALAQNSIWFRNTTTSHPFSIAGSVTMLTGTRGEAALPHFSFYPRNIFSLLSGNYQISAYETAGNLRGEGSGGGAEIQRTRRGIRTLARRAATFFLDVLFYKMGTQHLALSLFLIADRRAEEFKKLIENIKASEQPRFYFHHTQLTHRPWNRLPSGEFYTSSQSLLPGIHASGAFEHGWINNDWLIFQARQRHIFQLQFMDKLLGELVDKLKRINLYDEALIVLASDHGVAFQPGQPDRIVNEHNANEILPVLLMVKKPWQKTSVVNNRDVELVDITPTIADILGVKIPWRVDGQSALSEAPPEKRQKKIYYDLDLNNGGTAIFEDKRQIDVGGVYRDICPYQETLNRSLDEFNVFEGGAKAVILNRRFFNKINLAGGYLPALLGGSIFGYDNQNELHLAIAVNGVVRAATKTFKDNRGRIKFWAMIPKIAFQNGRNEITALIIKEDGSLGKLS